MSTETAIIVFGDDATVKPASASQREQGSTAFLRSASLTVNGASVASFRLNATTQTALVAALSADPTLRTVTLPMVKRGRPSQGIGLAAFVAAQAVPVEPKASPKG